MLVQWKVYDFDEPPNLRELLEERGFRAQHPEAFLVFPLDASCPPEGRPAPGIRLVKADSPQVVHDAAAVQEAVWKEEVAGLAPALIRRLQERPDQFSLYVAYTREKPVGTGWTDLAPHSHFADLHGGAVLPEWRGQGIYSMLLHQRCREAQERGYRYLAVDAGPHEPAHPGEEGLPVHLLHLPAGQPGVGGYRPLSPAWAASRRSRKRRSRSVKGMVLRGLGLGMTNSRVPGT